MSDVSSVTNHFATANEDFATTTSGVTTSGGNVVNLNSVSGLTNASIFVGVIEPGGAKEQVFTGVVDVSGSRITGVVWTKGTNVEHASGVAVVDYDTGTAFNMMRKGILVSHNQDGTLKNNSVTTDSINNSAVTSAKIADSAVTSAKLNPSKTTDANGWKVYDFGAFKMYTYSQYQSKSVINGQRTAFATYPLPSGTTYANLKIAGISWDGTYGGHVLAGVDSGGSGGWNVSLGNQYAGGTLIFSGYVTLTVIDV